MVKKVGVIGGGAVGLLLGAYLGISQYQATIYTRTKKQALTIEKETIYLYTFNKNLSVPIKAKTLFEQEKIEDDILFIAVKQYHLQTVIDLLQTRVSKSTTVVFLQNGMGHVAALQMFALKGQSVAVGIVEHGSLKLSNHEVKHTGNGQLKISFVNAGSDRAGTLWEDLTTSGFMVTLHNDWHQMLRDKLIVNAIINPLTALYKVKNGELVANSFFYQNAKVLFDEIAMVLPYTNEDWKRVISICERTSENKSSMLIDLENGAKTEVDAILGYVLGKAQEKGISLPYSQFLYYSMKGLEET